MTPLQQHRNWRPDVREVVIDLRREFPQVDPVTYIDHPWPGWDGQSFDVWRDAETWTPAPLYILQAIRKYLMNRPGRPFIRHTILRHRLWTSFGGSSRWSANDHSGRSRHLHVTYW